MEETSKELIGGKAYHLQKLQSLGFNVPSFTVLTTQLLEDIDVTQTDFINVDPIKSFISGKEDKLFSVRSSAVQEDGLEHSFAGQFESRLYVSKENLNTAIREVLKSGKSDRLKVYAKEKGLELSEQPIAVVIQEMIDPEVSGVAFGVDPVSNDAGVKLVSTVYGVGEGIVSGALNADNFRIKESGITKEIVPKEKQFIKGEKGAVEVDVPLKKVNEPTLQDDQIVEISKSLNKLEKEFGAPQDIEFAISNGEIFYLQSRAVTTLNDGEKVIWDNSNIIESYPGVTTPLTFSYIKRGYRNVYVQLALIMGASKRTVELNEETFSNMLGLIRGRVYYNLLSWYKVLSIFPGYSLNAEYMENMMGVKERFVLPKERKMNKIVALYRTGVMLYKIISNLFTIKKQTRQFLKEVDEIIKEYKSIDLSQKSAAELIQMWKEYDDRLLVRWKAPLINDSFAMYYFGTLQKLIEKYDLGANPNLQNDLLCGSKDIISTEPIHRSIAIASLVQKNEECKSLFENKKPKEIWESLNNESKYKEVLHLIEEYIQKFGDRCVGELKLETISFTNEPSLFIGVIKSFVVQGVSSSTTSSSVDIQVRSKAEKEVEEGLKGRFFRKRKFKSVLKKARYFVSNRENLRYDRTRVFGVTREIFVQIGKRFEENNWLKHHRDIFYLEIDEIREFIHQPNNISELQQKVEERKQRFEDYSNTPAPPERFTTYGPVNDSTKYYPSIIEGDLDGDLKGIGCCPGIVKGKVRVVNHPSEVDSLNGDILLTTSTDPGWVTLFPTASAIIVERGSLLSHSAIVSREMGIPCIVGVTGLLKRLKTGDEIEMDGSSGNIKIIGDE